MAHRIVVDSSVLIKWFKARNESLVVEARALLEEVERRPLEVHVPALLLYEVGNILLLKARLSRAAMDHALDRLADLPCTVAPPAAPLLKRAARLGRDYGLTFYDASFLALAVELDCPLITADRRLFDHVQALPRVRHLSRVGALS
ncbi:MAG TPA: type II toxin-antitoxin system VapC family toxin [Candidatus Sulfotelmatobacter sp.]|nr:type II toxin-antitoxin system VapC family toxin [Candidatus Sulfotelmatobacter sp.]